MRSWHSALNAAARWTLDDHGFRLDRSGLGPYIPPQTLAPGSPPRHRLRGSLPVRPRHSKPARALLTLPAGSFRSGGPPAGRSRIDGETRRGRTTGERLLELSDTRWLRRRRSARDPAASGPTRRVPRADRSACDCDPASDERVTGAEWEGIPYGEREVVASDVLGLGTSEKRAGHGPSIRSASAPRAVPIVERWYYPEHSRPLPARARDPPAARSGDQLRSDFQHPRAGHAPESARRGERRGEIVALRRTAEVRVAPRRADDASPTGDGDRGRRSNYWPTFSRRAASSG